MAGKNHSATSELILASGSPARARLLSNAGYTFTALASRVSEPEFQSGQSFEDYLMDVAALKAETLVKQHPHAYVIGADTLVRIEGRILGKPRDAIHAADILKQLVGRTHQIYTALCVRAPSIHTRENGVGEQRAIESSLVTLKPFTDRQISEYIDAHQTFSCAGAYALQGPAGIIVARVQGDPTNVIGLPMSLLRRLLNETGYRPLP